MKQKRNHTDLENISVYVDIRNAWNRICGIRMASSNTEPLIIAYEMNCGKHPLNIFALTLFRVFQSRLYFYNLLSIVVFYANFSLFVCLLLVELESSDNQTTWKLLTQVSDDVELYYVFIYKYYVGVLKKFSS